MQAKTLHIQLVDCSQSTFILIINKMESYFKKIRSVDFYSDDITDLFLIYDPFQIGVHEGIFFERCEEVIAAAMSFGHIHIQEKKVVIGFYLTEFCCPFERFPEHHPTVVEPGIYQDIGVILGFYVIVGRIGQDIVEVFFLIGISPFIVFRYSESESGIQHGV